MLMQIVNQLDDLMVGLRRAPPHALETADDLCHLPMVKPCQGGFSPFLAFETFSIDGGGGPMNPFRAVIVIENLTRLGKAILNLIPYPGCAIANDASAHLIFADQPLLFDVIEGFPDGVVLLHLMPA